MEKETKYYLGFLSLLLVIPVILIVLNVIYEPSRKVEMIGVGSFLSLLGFYYFKKFKALYNKPFLKLLMLDMNIVGGTFTLGILGILIILIGIIVG